MTELPEKKTEKVRRLVVGGDYKKALSIVKGFRLGISREDIEKITRAYECMVNPGFYEQLGRKPEDAIADGITVLKAHYGKKCEAPT